MKPRPRQASNSASSSIFSASSVTSCPRRSSTCRARDAGAWARTSSLTVSAREREQRLVAAPEGVVVKDDLVPLGGEAAQALEQGVVEELVLQQLQPEGVPPKGNGSWASRKDRSTLT